MFSEPASCFTTQPCFPLHLLHWYKSETRLPHLAPDAALRIFCAQGLQPTSPLVRSHTIRHAMSAANGTGVKKVNGHAGKSRSHSSSEPATTSQSASAKGKQKANGDDQYDAYTSALRGVEDSDMQQRQFTRVRDGQDLDELEGGSGTGYDNVAEKGRADSSGIRPKDTYNGHSYTSNDSEKHRNAGIRSPILRSETGLGHRRIASTASDKDDIPRAGLTERDKRAMVLLVALYLLQGLPVGLAFGSIPYLLRSKLSYSQIGIFTLCTYPYSLKLLWSPVVDSLFSPKLGRRKSWIIPIQLIVGSMLWWLSNNINQYMDKVSANPVERTERS